MADQPLFMIQGKLDRARLFELGRQSGMPIHRVDTGYLIHSALRALFGAQAPQPFVVRPARGRHLPVLGYAALSHQQLQEHAHQFADPLAYAVCDIDGLVSKPMPQSWPGGHTLGFEVRFCPIVRKASEGPKHRKGAEVDAFLARCWAVGESVPVDREEVYREWLRTQLERNNAARLREAKLVRFQRERLTRRTHRAEQRWEFCDRPDATMTGTLEVADAAAFHALLTRGVGRHRAFGFGMLLLSPPREH
jgi:CRISPR system Cascade subunit CasE